MNDQTVIISAFIGFFGAIFAVFVAQGAMKVGETLHTTELNLEIGNVIRLTIEQTHHK